MRAGIRKRNVFKYDMGGDGAGGVFRFALTVRSSGVSITSEIRLAEAELLVYIIKILVTDIMAMEMRVKYCIKAMTVSGSDLCSPRAMR